WINPPCAAEHIDQANDKSEPEIGAKREDEGLCCGQTHLFWSCFLFADIAVLGAPLEEDPVYLPAQIFF
ncbi:MAG: hypothetical protein AAF806_32665, partial [Bacteroidota bacterium]